MNKNGSKTGLLLSIQFLYNLIYGVKYVANGFILMVFGVWYHILSDFNWKIQTWNFYDSLFSIWGHTQTMWTALRLRGLWNVHFTNKAYLAKMSSKGEGVKQVQKTVYMVSSLPITNSRIFHHVTNFGGSTRIIPIGKVELGLRNARDNGYVSKSHRF